jgi:hypothetical protein
MIFFVQSKYRPLPWYVASCEPVIMTLRISRPFKSYRDSLTTFFFGVSVDDLQEPKAQVARAAHTLCSQRESCHSVPRSIRYMG